MYPFNLVHKGAGHWRRPFQILKAASQHRRSASHALTLNPLFVLVLFGSRSLFVCLSVGQDHPPLKSRIAVSVSGILKQKQVQRSCEESCRAAHYNYTLKTRLYTTFFKTETNKFKLQCNGFMVIALLYCQLLFNQF